MGNVKVTVFEGDAEDIAAMLNVRKEQEPEVLVLSPPAKSEPSGPRMPRVFTGDGKKKYTPRAMPNIAKLGRHVWSKEDSEIVRKFYLNPDNHYDNGQIIGERLRELSRRLNRTPDAIQIFWIQSLGFKTKRDKIIGPHKKLASKTIAKQKEKKAAPVVKKGSRANSWKGWTPEQDAELVSLLRKGLSFGEAGRQLGRTRTAVKHRAYKFKDKWSDVRGNDAEVVVQEQKPEPRRAVVEVKKTHIFPEIKYLESTKAKALFEFLTRKDGNKLTPYDAVSIGIDTKEKWVGFVISTLQNADKICEYFGRTNKLNMVAVGDGTEELRYGS